MACCFGGSAVKEPSSPPPAPAPLPQSVPKVPAPTSVAPITAPSPAGPAAPIITPEKKSPQLPPATQQQPSDTLRDGQSVVSQSSMHPPWLGQKTNSTTDNSLPQDALVGPSNTSVSEIVRLNLGEVKQVLQKLAGVNSTPIIALNEAAELLCKHLNVGLCSILGYAEHCTASVLLAAYGSGASELERTPVMSGQNWSSARLLEQPQCLYYSVNSAEAVATLPADFQSLYQSGNLRSFLSIPIATDHEVVGALTIAKEEADGFEVDWWEPMLGCLSMGLLVYIRNEQTQALCQLMKNLDSSSDYVLLVDQLLHGAHNLLLRATNIRTGCRLALLSGDVLRALIFEPDRKAAAAPDAERTPESSIHVTEINLENTLLLDAVQKGKARFVSDCASYIQSCMKPATDIFISGQEMVASIVVLPLIYDGISFGGFYVTLETTSNFQNIKDMLMGFVNSVVLVLAKRLAPQREQIWENILSKSPPGGAPEEGRAEGDVGDSGTQQGASQAQSNNSGSGANSTQTTAKPLVVKRSCTEAMLKVLQHELRKSHAKTQQHQWIEELVLSEIVGKGGFGVVYKGTWKGSVAAVKVMYARQHERQAMKDALEMAVLTTVSHPNIIQVYNCFTDMVEDASGANLPMQDGKINVRFRRLQPEEDRSLATCNILVMEYCDKASLRHAMKKGVFHKRLGNTSVAVDLCAIVQVLIEVSQAIQHLHSMKLIHCDIKPENVLLKSDTKALGFVTKLSDFGLAKLLRENYYIVNRSGSGTVTHLAPELFQVGSKLTTAVDTFSFGIMMWELYTGQRAYGGLGRDAIIDRVYKKKARPIFPLGVPAPYAALAKSCWDNDPTARPTFLTILAKLQEMLQAFQSSSMAPGGGGGGGGDATPGSSRPPSALPQGVPLGQ